MALRPQRFSDRIRRAEQHEWLSQQFKDLIRLKTEKDPKWPETEEAERCRQQVETLDSRARFYRATAVSLAENPPEVD